MHRRQYALLLILVMLLSMFSAPAQAVSPSDWKASEADNLQPDHLYSKTAVLLDADTGDVLFDKDANVRMYPASTTKIMTLLLALESDIPLDSEITIPQEAANIASDSSVVPVYPGEVMSFQDLLYGLMLVSGNDAANAVAVLVGGSINNFVRLMNERAAAIGCKNTHFANPHGLHDELHYTTAYDLALITREAMQNETFREIVAAPRYTMAPTVNRGDYVITSRVSMLNQESDYYYEDCIGVKTGYTSKAGQCFVGAAKRDGVTLICVALNSKADNQNLKWVDAQRLFAYGYTQYDYHTLEEIFADAGSGFNTTSIPNAAKDDVQKGLLTLRLTQLSEADYGLLVRHENTAYSKAIANFISRSTITLREGLQAPIADGEIVGSLTYTTWDGSEITGMLTANRAVEARPEQVTVYEILPFLKPIAPLFASGWGIYVLLVIAALIVFLIVVRAKRRLRQNRRRQKIYDIKRRQYQQQMAQKRREEERRRQEQLRMRRERARKAAALSKKPPRGRAGKSAYQRPDSRRKPPMGGR